MKVRAAASLREFEASPVDRYVVEGNFCGLQYGLRHAALLYRGDVDEGAAKASVRFIARGGQPPMQPGCSILDARGLTHVSPAAFQTLLDFMLSTRDMWTDRVLKQAIVCDEQTQGASVVGLLHYMKVPYPIEFFARRDQAMAWIDAPPGFVQALDEVDAAWRGGSPLEAKVVAAYAALGLAASSGDIAAQLGTSTRSLQRRLGEQGTTLRAIRESSQLEMACQLLSTSTLPVAEVATRVGFATPSSFVAWFDARQGTTPRRWRLRQSG